MRNPTRRSAFRTVIAAFLGAVLAAASVLTALASPAGAAGNPPWEPDANSVGGLVFYNASGQQITGGNLTDSPVAAYIEGTVTVRAGDTKATLYGYSPIAGTAPGTWGGEALGSSTTYPNSGAPAPLNTATLPVETGSSGDTTVATLESDFPNTNSVASGYAGLYQLRLKTTASGKPPNTTYLSADISIDSVHGTWSVVYPAITPIVTTTTLTASPTSPQPSGTTETLTATVSPAAPGTVQFENGATAIGSPQTVNATTGVATLSTAALPVGALTLHAVFTPAQFAAYAGSTGTTSFTVTSSANPTTTTLTASPTSPQPFGTSETLTATVSPVAAGTVQFQNGATNLGAPVTVSAGVATLVTSALPVGSLTLHAVFTPTAGSGFGGSTGTTSFTVNPIATTTTLTASPVSPQFLGTSETLTATVSPVASGTVQFQNGATNLGTPVTVSAGVATLVTSALPVGSLTLNAVFTPAAGNGFSSSTGSTSFTVNPATPTTTTLAASPSSPQTFGTPVTLTATVSPVAAGTVQFQNGATNLGTPVTVSAGVATLGTSTLPVGSLTLNAVFTPTAGSGFGGSTGTTPFTISPIATTTALTVSPVSPQFAGTPVTLTGTVSPTAPGTVQFQNGSTNLGTPVAVSAGVAAYTTSALPVGSLALHAVFTPTPGSGYGGSTGTATYTVVALTPTSTSLTVSPTGPQLVGTSETLTATVSPVTTGTVQFEVGSTPIGVPAPVSAGVATYTTTALPPGNLTLGAVFTPTAGNGFAGSTGTTSLTITGTSGSASTPDGNGYWLAANDGGVFAYGNAPFFGSTGGQQLNAPIVGFGSTPTGKGYRLVAADGGVFSYGDAAFYGSTGGQHLNAPIVKFATTQDGKGYWLVASDGGVFSYGDAVFYGSTGGQQLNAPIVGIASKPDGKGYWLVASDGGVFSYGDAVFYGSTGGAPLNAPIVGITSTPDGQGYWLFAADGGVFSYGDAGYFGSAAGLGLTEPIV